ncbi:unnamed protein product [Haemonchus placei]|uniref:Component of oligomeric Golgi complex 3 n=1 Tax=Haemonchus placei TaxID=6290 RepID=A0A0N4W6Z9_HAEPC|nr:unnamed protein product [Haemonchus placei]
MPPIALIRCFPYLAVCLCSHKGISSEMRAPLKLRTVMLAIRSTREILKHHHNQVEKSGDLYYLPEAHYLTNEIRNLEIITSGYHKTIEQLKRACIRKRITLAKATEELFIKANHELNNSLSYLDNVCSSAVCALESRSSIPVVHKHRPVRSLRSPSGLVKCDTKAVDGEYSKEISHLEDQLDI